MQYDSFEWLTITILKWLTKKSDNDRANEYQSKDKQPVYRFCHKEMKIIIYLNTLMFISSLIKLLLSVSRTISGFTFTVMF